LAATVTCFTHKDTEPAVNHEVDTRRPATGYCETRIVFAEISPLPEGTVGLPPQAAVPHPLSPSDPSGAVMIAMAGVETLPHHGDRGASGKAPGKP